MVKAFARALFRLSIADWRSLRRLPKSLAASILSIKAGDIVIDCGANSGRFSSLFARLGAHIIAFEPDPVAFRELKKNTESLEGLELHEAAVGVADGEALLFFHEDRELDPLHFSSGSSLHSEKPNVGGENLLVKTVDLAALIRSRGFIRAVKIDIEGYETTLVPHLINTGATDSIGEIWVETHERKWPSLAQSTGRMRQIAGSQPSGNCVIRFDWP